MGLVKNLSLIIASTGCMVLAAAAEAKAVSLKFERIIGDTSGPGQLKLPQGVDIQEGTGNIYISDSDNDRVAVFNPEGKFLFNFGQDQIDETADLEFNDKTGQIFVGDVRNNQIDVFEPNGTYIRSFGEFTIDSPRFFKGPGGVAFSPDFETFYVNDYAADRILAFDSETGEQTDVIGKSGNAPGQLLGPSGLSISKTTGNLYISEQLNSRIQVLSPEGESLGIIGKPSPRPLDPFAPVPDLKPGVLTGPVAVEVDKNNNIYVGDTQNNRLQVFDHSGEVLTVVDEIPAEPSTFFWTVGAHYEDGKFYSSDFFHNRVVMYEVVPEPSSVLGIGVLGVGVAAGKLLRKHRRQKPANSLANE
jgi:DNA-binding beta-propeller fold protein YncE